MWSVNGAWMGIAGDPDLWWIGSKLRQPDHFVTNRGGEPERVAGRG